MKVLALDTATEACSVALLTDDGLFARFEEVGRGHAEVVLDMVNAVFSEAGVSADSIDGIAAGVGPGSFTGVRISVSVAQGLAFGAGVPVVAITSLEALALQAMRGGAEHVMACLDARMGEVYWGLFSADARRGLVARGPLAVGPASAVAAAAQAFTSPAAVVTAAQAFTSPDAVVTAAQAFTSPDAAVTAASEIFPALRMVSTSTHGEAANFPAGVGIRSGGDANVGLAGTMPGSAGGTMSSFSTGAGSGSLIFHGIGRGFGRYPELASLPGLVLPAGAALALPDAREIARLGMLRLQAGEGLDAAELTPVYVRDKVALTEAERAAAKGARGAVE